MRLLHVGSGFRPWRQGGLVAYIEDLMAEQVARGHEVTYFFSGRQYPWIGGPRLRRWERGGVAMREVVNSPLHEHGRQPDLEQAEPRIERMLECLIRELRPDAVHVQELAGLPSSVLDIPRLAGVPTIVTLQDYFPLCPTFKLLDAEGRVCLRREIGADCVATTAARPSDPSLLFEATLRHGISHLPLVRRVDPGRRDPWIERISVPLARRAAERRPRVERSGGVAAAAFQRRRDVNVARLNGADRVIAMSARVAEIYALLGVQPDRLRTLQLTLEHLEHLRPRRLEERSRRPQGGQPITFATLGGLASTAKGGRVLIDAMRSLSDAVSAGRLRLLVFGFVDGGLRDEAVGVPGVELRGPYAPEQLDALLEEVEVGIMPSLWEEAYGYAGLEFLAKGIPVIANAIGGMVEYTREGETGWLNHSCSAEELARIMLGVLDDPEQIVELNGRLRAGRAAIVKPMSRHADEMDSVYSELIAARDRAARSGSAAAHA